MPGDDAPSPARCWWAREPLEIAYHDEEWGVPLHDDAGLFELLMLEAFQAGLAWSTILRKRPTFRSAFAEWDPRRIAAFDERDVARLLADAGIIRNRQKIVAAIQNARVFLALQAEHGSFDRYIWSFAPSAPVPPVTPADVPPGTPEAAEMSKALKKAGMRFVGPTICYAFMQSAGLVNDHLVSCFRRNQV